MICTVERDTRVSLIAPNGQWFPDQKSIRDAVTRENANVFLIHLTTGIFLVSSDLGILGFRSFIIAELTTIANLLRILDEHCVDRFCVSILILARLLFGLCRCFSFVVVPESSLFTSVSGHLSKACFSC